MKNFVKRHTPGIIALALLSVIAALLFAYRPYAAVYSSPLTEKDLEPLSSVDPDPLQQEPIQQIGYEKTLPKSASPSEQYLYRQQACGVGDVIPKEAHFSQTGLYVVAETNCRNGDIEGQKDTVGVLKFDSSGNLEKAFSIGNGNKLYYVASKMTVLGLVVVTKTDSESFLYVTIIGYDLSEGKTTLLSYADHVGLFATQKGFLLFGAGNEGVLYEYDERGYRFFSLPAVETVKVFEYGDRYAVFCNSGTGYALCEVQKTTFSVLREKRSSGRLLDVYPILSDGQKYALIVEDGGLIVKSVDPSDLSETTERKLGAYRVIGTGTEGENIYLAVQGAVNGVVKIDKSLAATFTVTDIGFLPTKILDSYYDERSFFLLLSGEDKSAVVKMDADSSTVLYLPKSDFGRLCPNQNGTFCAVLDGKFYNYSAVDLFGISI